jgi:hypothetical protein
VAEAVWVARSGAGGQTPWVGQGGAQA